MSFVITLQVDGTQAKHETKGVGVELDGAAAKGSRAGAAIGGGMRDGEAAARRAAAAVGNVAKGFQQIGAHLLSEQLGGVSKAFAGVTEQLRREADMLERLHGPMKQAIQDHQTLEMLQRRGMITASQYAQEMARLHNANNPMSSNSGAEPGMLSKAGGAIQAVATVGAAKEILELGDTYIGLENRLRGVSKSQAELNFLMSATKGIADRTRSDWGATAESFVRLTNATKQLGISQERALHLQETLNMALQSSGASSAEATAGTLQLMQALSAGALQGDEFRSISESLPDLMDIFAKQLGVTRGELKKMGAEGKITTDIVVRGLEAASGTIKDKFMASTATASQQWTVFKNQLTETAGEFVKNSHIVDILGGLLKTLASVLGPVASLAGGVVGAFQAVTEKATSLASAVGVDLNLGLGTLIGTLLGGRFGAAIGTFAEGLARSGPSLAKYREGIEANQMAMEAFQRGVESTWPSVEKLVASLDNLHAKLAKIATGGKSGGGLITDAVHALGQLGQTSTGYTAFDAFAAKFKMALDVQAPVLKAKSDLAILDEAWKSTADHMGMSYAAYIAKRNSFLAAASPGSGGRKVNASDVFGDVAGREMRDTIEAMKDAEKAAAALAKTKKGLAGLGGAAMRGGAVEAANVGHKDQAAQEAAMATAATKRWNEELSRARENAKALAEQFRPVEDALVELAQTGEFRWRKMIDSMILDTERLLAKKVVAGILGLGSGSAADGLVAGGGPGIMPISEASAPYAGHATGASWMVGGRGGTDRNLVQFMASDNERVTVETPSQQRDSDHRAMRTPPLTVHVIDQRDRGILQTPADVTRVVLDDIKQNTAKYRSLLGRN